MTTLFSPFRLRELTLENRVVLSPMVQFSADDGAATDWHLVHLGQYGLGGAGLVLTEATAVTPEGRISAYDTGIWDDTTAAAWQPIADFFHEHTGAAFGIQLAHAGRKGAAQPPWGRHGAEPPQAGSWQTVGPSEIPYATMASPVALDRSGIGSIRSSFADAAARADRHDADIVEVHAAHGYLLHQFLSPLSNTRTDEYGGSLENRMRLPLEVIAAVREVWPDHKPLAVRISATDWVEGGWDLAQSIEFGARAAALGCDVLTASSGGLSPDQEIPVEPEYQVPFARGITDAVPDLVVIAVGLITGAEQAERIVCAGDAHLVALAREMLYDPYWPRHAAHELGAEIEYPRQHDRGDPKARPGRPDRVI